MEKHKEIIQIAIIGNLRSGKTSLRNAILGEEFSPSYLGTSTIDYSKRRRFGSVLVEIMDTPGKQTNSFFSINLDCQQAHIFIVCVNLAERSTLNKVDKYVDDIKWSNINNPFVLLVGTNADWKSEKNITYDELVQKAKALGCHSCFFTSAKENTAIDTVRNELETLVREIYNKKNAARVSSASENLSRRNSSRLSSTVSNNNPSSNSISKRESNQVMVLFWQRHKHKIINGIIIGTFAMIATTLTLVLPVAPLLASIGLIIPFTGLAFTATLAGIGAAVGLVAGSVAAGIKSGIEALVKFFQHKETKEENVDNKKDQSYFSKKKSGFLKPVLNSSNVSSAKKVDLPQNFSSPIEIELGKENKQMGNNTTSRMIHHALSNSP